MDFVQRGVGIGEGAEVTDKRAWTYAITIQDSKAESFIGRQFNANTGTINLTSANESAVAYLVNNGSTPVIVTTIGYLMGNAKDGVSATIAEEVSMMVRKKPINGTIVTNAVAGQVNANRNVGKSDINNVLFYKGVEGDTLTDGIELFPSLLPSPRTYSIPNANVILNEGESIGVLVKPPTGNVSMNLQVFINYDIQDLGNKLEVR